MPQPQGRFWHVRVRRPVKGGRFRVLALGGGVLATRRLVGGKWRTYKLMFAKSRFSHAEARRWVTKHKGQAIVAGNPKRKRRRKQGSSFLDFLPEF